MQKKIFFLAAMTAAVSANAQKKIMIDGHEAVDLGLSVLWATCNVGAENDNPEDFGDFFAWGETQTKTTFEFDNYKFYDEFSDNENLVTLGADHDAATQQFGKKWRMPTEEDFMELYNNCDLTISESPRGFIFKAENGDSIFLPSAGSFNEGQYYGGFGTYWTKNFYFGEEAVFLHFDDSGYYECYANHVSYGHSVRAVYDKPEASKLNYVEKNNANTVYKTVEKGQIVIVKNGVKYNLRGQKI